MNLGLSPKFKLKVEEADLDDVFADVVRVAHRYREFSRAGEVIVVYCNGRTLRATARGIPGNRKDVIAIDSRCRQILAVRPGEIAEFQFAPADTWDEVVWAWNATDAMPRIAARFGIMGLGLGLIGLFLGCVSIAS